MKNRIATRIRIRGSRSCAFQSQRGLTLVEVQVMMLISMLITGVVIGLMYETGLATKNMYAETRTRSTRMIALDQVRYRLSNAKIDTITISNSNRTIQFSDPNNGTNVFSSFTFVPATNKLFYDDDIADSDAAIEVADGPIDFTFELDASSNAALIKLNVKSAADVSFGDVDEQDGETAIYLRNI